MSHHPLPSDAWVYERHPSRAKAVTSVPCRDGVVSWGQDAPSAFTRAMVAALEAEVMLRLVAQTPRMGENALELAR